MTAREMQSVQEGMRGPFGVWLFAFLRKSAEETRTQAANVIPQNPFEATEREQNFGKARAYDELVDDLPTVIGEKLKELVAKETQK